MSKKKHPEIITELSDNLKVHLLKALEADPRFSEAHFELALMYKENGDHKKAEFHFREAIESDRQQILEIEKQGKNLLKRFQFQNANVLFIKSQEKKHHCASVNFQLAALYESKRKFSKAQTCLKISIELNPSSAIAHRNLGILLSHQKKYDDARVHIEKALDLNYSDQLSHLNLGLLMKQNRDYANAELHFLIALDINPKFALCMLEMALLYLIMKNQTKAKKYYHKARAISPDITATELDKILQ